MHSGPVELKCEIAVSASPDAAFRRFADEFSDWWPAEYTWSQEHLGWIGMDPQPGGRCTERSRDGFIIDFGRVLLVDRPESLVFAWCIDMSRVPVPDIDKAGTVTVEFSPQGSENTLVIVEHTHFERYGEAGGEYRDVMASEYGWPYILKTYAASFVYGSQ